MTVVELAGRIVVVDAGLAFPRGEARSRPRLARLRLSARARGASASSSPTVARIISGRCPSSCPRSGRRRAAVDRRRADARAGALEAGRAPGCALELRASTSPRRPLGLGPAVELTHMTHSVPDASAVGICIEPATVLIPPASGSSTRHPHRRRCPPTPPASPSSAQGRALAAGIQRTASVRVLPQETVAVRHLPELFARCPRALISCRSFASTSTGCSRGRGRARGRAQGRVVGRSMRKNLGIVQLGHIEVPNGHARRAPRDRRLPRRAGRDPSPPARRASLSRRCAGWPTATIRQVELHDGDTVVFSATPIPGNERAVNETIDRLYHIGCDVITPPTRPCTPPATATRRRSS